MQELVILRMLPGCVVMKKMCHSGCVTIDLSARPLLIRHCEEGSFFLESRRSNLFNGWHVPRRKRLLRPFGARNDGVFDIMTQSVRKMTVILTLNAVKGKNLIRSFGLWPQDDTFLFVI
jgi:hypothetical protein